MVAAGVAGLLLYVWRDARAGLRFVLLPVVYFVLIGGGQTAFARHIIPTLPFLCLGAAYCARELARTMERLMPSRVPAALPGLVIAAIVALPSARSSIETDRLLSRTDSRLLAADWILEQFPDGVTIYQSGSSYAQVQFPVLADRGTPRFREVGFDEPSGSFLTRDGVSAEPPDLIVRPRCALSYCDVPPRLTAVLAGYTLLATIVAVDPTAGSQLVYDRDDAFFVPLAGFAGALRPGPDELIYGRRSTP